MLNNILPSVALTNFIMSPERILVFEFVPVAAIVCPWFDTLHT